MVTTDEFDLWALKAEMPEAGKAYIQRVRTSPPSRKAGNNHGSNVIGSYPSRKMGVTINFESHKCELPAIHLHERDDAVLEYWDQPESIKISYPGKTRKTDSFLYTPDFLVLRTGGAVLQEWKNEKDLVAQSVKAPNRYVKRDDGGWSCPPGEAAAAELGLGFEVHSTDEINWFLQRNIVFLEDYFRKAHVVAETITAEIIAVIAANPGIPLNELKSLGQKAGASSDDVHALIAAETIYVDLSAAPLSEPARVRVFSSPAVAAAYSAIETEVRGDGPGCSSSVIRLQPGSSLIWNGVPLHVKVVGETKIAFTDKAGQLVELTMDVVRTLIKDGDIANAVDLRAEQVAAREKALDAVNRMNPEYVAEANRRLTIIKPYLERELSEDDPLPPGRSAATIYRWLSRYRESKATCGHGFLGLIPKARSGNTESRIQPEVQDAVDEKIALLGKERKKRCPMAVYREVKAYCKAKNLLCPSRKSISLRAKSLSSYETVKFQSGKRKAYQIKDFYYEVTYTTPRHGERPFEIGHIDHTVADVEMKDPATQQKLGRPNMTFLVDAFCRRILAVYVSFEQPSYRSCMAVLRICVKRHNRLPRIIVIDNGPEFHSIYFEALLAMFECTRKVRPPAQPRAGTVIENLFNTTNVQFIDSLMGNTKPMKEVRTVTKSHDPSELAVWTLEPFYKNLCHYAYELHDTLPHGTLKQSPRNACLTGLQQSGERAQHYIAYDEAFRMLTLPTTSRKTARIVPRYGVKINGIYYQHDDFKRASLHGKRVHVRYEPWDISIAYAYVDGFWLRCISQHPKVFQHMSEKMLMLLTARLKQQAKQHGRDVEEITAAKLAAFYETLRHDEQILTQEARDCESRNALRVVDNGESTASIRGNAMAAPPEETSQIDSASPPDQPRQGFTNEIDDTEYEDLAS